MLPERGAVAKARPQILLVVVPPRRVANLEACIRGCYL